VRGSPAERSCRSSVRLPACRSGRTAAESCLIARRLSLVTRVLLDMIHMNRSNLIDDPFRSPNRF
jgi:hypothetical protein